MLEECKHIVELRRLHEQARLGGTRARQERRTPPPAGSPGPRCQQAAANITSVVRVPEFQHHIGKLVIDAMPMNKEEFNQLLAPASPERLTSRGKRRLHCCKLRTLRTEFPGWSHEMVGVDVLSIVRDNLRRALAAATDVPDPGRRWAAYSQQTRDFAKRATNVTHVIETALSWQGSYETRHSGAALSQYAAMLDCALRSQFPQFADALVSFAEVESAPIETIVEHGGRRVSSAILEHTFKIMRCLAHVRPNIVLDIGGGTGSTGRLWLTNAIHRPKCYIDLDLPESLFYAETYFRNLISDAEIRYVHDASDVNGFTSSDSDRCRILLVPVHNHRLIDRIPIDLITNIGSLQEMTTEYVDFYMNLIERSSAPLFYSSNYFGQRIELLIESMNYAAPVLGRHWAAVYRQYWPDPVRGVAEIIFRRTVEPSEITSIEDFLIAFDALRGSDDTARIMRVVTQARKELPFVPKELLYLTRKARLLDPGSTEIASVLRELESLAAVGVQNIGMIGPALER